jgi:hypothetical protein
MHLDSNPQRSAAARAIVHLPEHVQRVITELVADTSVHEIWLVGSQVDGTEALWEEGWVHFISTSEMAEALFPGPHIGR